ncbi:MAG: LysE family transporter [Clostridiales bacterium]|jgi:threonine/homoserine/homoserine lactone efflux protein|nr:LysE family transporter [Clostridiales bacterium]
MEAWGIFLSSFMIGFSGAMMPGPMLGVTIDGSLKRGYLAGPLVVLGHGILELFLVIVMAFGLRDLFENPKIAGLIGLVGGGFLAWMGYGMVRSAIQKNITLSGSNRKGFSMKSLVWAGIIVSLTNPYFIMWWASTGMELIRQAYIVGLAGVAFFYVGHIMSDFVWYSAVSLGVSRGKKFISDAAYRWVIFVLGIFLIGFSLYFITSGIKMLI